MLGSGNWAPSAKPSEQLLSTCTNGTQRRTGVVDSRKYDTRSPEVVLSPICTAPSCFTPTNDDYLCSDCLRVFADDLGKIEWLWQELEVTRTRQARTQIGDHVGGKSAETPIPWQESASRAADMLHNCVFTWAYRLDEVADEHIEPSRLLVTVEWMIRNHRAVARLEQAGQIAKAFEGVVLHCLKVIDHPALKTSFEVGPCPEPADEGACEGAVYAYIPVDANRPAMLRCLECEAAWNTTQWLHTGKRMLKLIEEVKSRGKVAA